MNGEVSVWFIDTIQGISQATKNQPLNTTSKFQQNIKEATIQTLDGLVSGVTEQSNLTIASVVLIANPAKNIEHLNNHVANRLLIREIPISLQNS